MQLENKDWDLVIESKRSPFRLNLLEIIRYKDLLLLFVKRDFVVVYKQTILGPIWFFLQPVLTTVMYTFVFGSVANLYTDELPKPLFYLTGIVIWNFFSECFLQTSETFVANQDLFGKVYFPRLVSPLSKVLSGLVKFGIQFVLFVCVLIYYWFQGFSFQLNYLLFFFPVFIFMMSALGLGFGLIFTSLTTKYRDLRFLIQFGVQLLQYASIIIPFSITTGWKRDVLFYNPIVHIVEGFRLAFLGKGEVLTSGLMYSFVFSIVVLFFGIFIFNKTEKTFIDTV